MMKNLLFLLMLSVGFMSFSSNAKANADLDVITGPCTSCPEDCCAIILSNPNGNARTITICCELISVVRI